MSSKVITKRYIITTKVTDNKLPALDRALKIAIDIIAALTGKETTYKEIDL